MDEGMTEPWKLEKVERLGLKREAGFQYQLSGRDILRAPIDPPSEWTTIHQGGFEREEGYSYALDLEGDIVRFKKT
jgi:hypothetical protein